MGHSTALFSANKRYLFPIETYGILNFVEPNIHCEKKKTHKNKSHNP
jgi:hypothetical protein